jgi:hypothetical protein
VCQLCSEKLEHHSQLNHHSCYTPIPELKVPTDENKIFVFDVEATQKKLDDDEALYIHNCNLICNRLVYNQSDFMQELLSNPFFRGGIILAHNGGAYDCKFIPFNLIPFRISFNFF